MNSKRTPAADARTHICFTPLAKLLLEIGYRHVFVFPWDNPCVIRLQEHLDNMSIEKQVLESGRCTFMNTFRMAACRKHLDKHLFLRT